MPNEAPLSWHFRAAPVLGPFTISLGGALTVAILATSWIDTQLGLAESWLGWPFALGVSMMLAGIVWLVTTATALRDASPRTYDVLLARVGYGLVVASVLAFIALFGLASRGVLEEVLGLPPVTEVVAAVGKDATEAVEKEARPKLPDGLEYLTEGERKKEPEKNPHLEGARQRVIWGARMVLMPGFAILGSLFFVCGSLRRKREATEEDGDDLVFSGPRFWSGFWYRVGEGILFCLVVFLASYAGLLDGARQWSGVLLLLGLLMAMFVKPAEQLVNGLALRLFDAISSFTQGGGTGTPTTAASPLTGIVARLGDPSEAVRLQALDDLERQGTTRYSQVIDLLASFIRNPIAPATEDQPAPADVLKAFRALGTLAAPRDQVRPAITLRGVVLHGVRGGNLDLREVDLAEADLRGADLPGALLTGAVLRGARLEKAKLATTKGLTEANVEGATFDGETTFPEGFDAKAKGMKDVRVGVEPAGAASPV